MRLWQMFYRSSLAQRRLGDMIRLEIFAAPAFQTWLKISASLTSECFPARSWLHHMEIFSCLVGWLRVSFFIHRA
jgi:hypothetical protein